MDIERIRYFHVFSESGSQIKAAELLHISPPALSKALKVLQEEVGIKLLTYEGRNLKLTSAGIEFKKKTESLINQWTNLPQLLESNQKETKIRIGTFEVFSTYFLRKLTAKIDLYGLELRELGPGPLEEAILSNVVDFGITYLPIPRNGLEFLEVAQIEMGVYGLEMYKKQKWDDLPFVVPLSPINGSPSKVNGLDGWPDHQYQRKIAFQVTLMESALEFCRQGKAMAYLPKFVVELYNQLVQPQFKLVSRDLPMPKKTTKQAVYIVKKVGEEDSAIIKQIAKILRELS